MEQLRPNDQRAKNAIILIWIVMGLEFVSFISSYFQYDLLQSISDGKFLSQEAADANDTRERIVGLISIVAYIVSCVTFIQWFRRAYYNLHLIKPGHLSHSEGWAAGSWFVPFINLYRPYQIMKELYLETEIILSQKIKDFKNITTYVLGIWWTLWIINNFVGQFVFRYGMAAETVDQLIITTVTSMVGNVLGILLALVAIKIVKDYSDVEPLLADALDNTETTPDSGDLQLSTVDL